MASKNPMQSKPENYETLLEEMRAVYATGKTKSYNYRMAQLKAMKRMMEVEEGAITEALAADLGRCQFEAVGLEVVGMTAEINLMLDNLKSWMEPEYTSIPGLMAPATNEIVYEPLGVCLIVGAFNYPIMLTLSPLLGAIVAGNVAVIKPSEMSSATERLIADMVPRYLDGEAYRVVCGGIQTNIGLLNERWDKIFFTGSIRVGKIVAAAAAKHLTPTCLELGGKSPVVIDEALPDMDVVTQRICWGKFANAGQTCIAPDYVLCHEKHYDAFCAAVVKKAAKFYGENPKESPDFGRIVSSDHVKRLKGLLDDAPGKVLVGGTCDVAERYVAPTIIADVRLDSKLMSDEIFGPILPIIKIKSMDEACKIIKTMEKPLALYIFSQNRSVIDRVCKEITSGGVLVNDCLYHFGNPYTPFGGVGPSGMGGYHGRFSFDAFSHRRTIMRRDTTPMLDVPIRYPPYSAGALNTFKFIAANAGSMPSITRRTVGFALLAVVCAGVALYMGVNNKKYF
jgi:aldehyde dehydrogenase (NAD+)